MWGRLVMIDWRFWAILLYAVMIALIAVVVIYGEAPY